MLPSRLGVGGSRPFDAIEHQRRFGSCRATSEHLSTKSTGTQAMPRCSNCDEFVTENYVRVFAPSELETVRVCPYCEDIVRDGAAVREAKAPRHN
jgi:NAD-dependent SIR2 family protein deacetylase